MSNSVASDLSPQHVKPVVQNTMLQSTSQDRKCAKNKAPSSQHLSDYLHYFAEVDDKVGIALSRYVEVLAKQNIRVLAAPPGRNTPQLTCQSTPLVKLQYGGAVATYTIRIGRYEMQAIVLNLPYPNPNNKSTIIGKGSFGSVLAVPNRGGWVSKRIYFQGLFNVMKDSDDDLRKCIQSTNADLKDALIQYGFFRIASALGIGPYLRHGESFDLICFSDCVEFLVERCLPANIRKLSTPLDKFKLRMDFCVRAMHKLHLIHKDIKPENIMYSHYWKNYVLVDYGISSAVKEEVGERSLTYRAGTKKYMSLEMHRLSKTEEGYADLYYNDLNCLEMTLGEIGSPMYYPAVHPNFIKGSLDEVDWHNVFDEVHKMYCGEVKEVRTTHEKVVEALSEYFPLDVHRNNPKQLKFWDVDLLARAVGLVPELSPFLKNCDQKDPKVRKLNQLLSDCHGMRMLNLQIATTNSGRKRFQVKDMPNQKVLLPDSLMKQLRLALEERSIELCQQTLNTRQSLQYKETPSVSKCQILVKVLMGDRVDHQRLLSIRQKTNRQEFWWLLFHMVRLSLERYLLEDAIAYAELLKQETNGRLLTSKTSPTRTTNKYHLVLDTLYSLIHKLSCLEDEHRWWQLCSFIVREFIRQGLCKNAIELCQEYLDNTKIQYRYELILFVAKAYNKINSLEIALSSYLDCLDISPQLFAEDSPEKLRLLCRIADLYSHLKLSKKAKQTINQIAIQIDKKEKLQIEYLGVYMHLVMIYVRVGQQQSAAQLSESTLKLEFLEHSEYLIAKTIFYRGAFFYQSASYTNQPWYINDAAEAFMKCRQYYLKQKSPLIFSFYLQSLYYIGMYSFNVKKYEQAIRYFQECVNASEGKCNNHQARVKCLFRLMMCFKSMDDKVRLFSVLDKVSSVLDSDQVTGDGFCSEYQRLLVKDYLKEEKLRRQITSTRTTATDNAIEVIEMAQTNRLLNEKQLSVMIKIGEELYKKGQYIKAVKCFSIGYDRSLQCIYYIGMCLYHMGDYDKSRSVLRDFVSRTKCELSTSQLMMLGLTQRTLAEISRYNNEPMNMKRYIADAIATFLKIKEEEYLAVCYNNIGVCKYILEDCQEAVKWLVRAERYSSIHNQLSGQSFDYDIAMCYSRLKLHRKCHRHLAKWLKKGEYNPQGLYHYAKCSLILKKTRCFLQVVCKLPHYDNREHYRQLLVKFLQQQDQPLKMYLAFGGDIDLLIGKLDLDNEQKSISSQLKKLSSLKLLLRSLKYLRHPTEKNKLDIQRVASLLKRKHP